MRIAGFRPDDVTEVERDADPKVNAAPEVEQEQEQQADKAPSKPGRRRAQRNNRE